MKPATKPAQIKCNKTHVLSSLIGHGFCCILFELALSLVSYRTATPCWRVPIRTKQLSTVAALFCRFLSGCCLAKSTLSRSISLAVCVTVYFWLIRSLVDPTSTDSIIVRGPLQFSRLLLGCLNLLHLDRHFEYRDDPGDEESSDT